MTGTVDFIKVMAAQERQMDRIEMARRLRDQRNPGTPRWVSQSGMLRLDLLASGTQSGCIGGNGGVWHAYDGSQPRQKLIVQARASIAVLVVLIGQLKARGRQLCSGDERTD